MGSLPDSARKMSSAPEQLSILQAILQGVKQSPTVSKFDVWDERAVSHSSGVAILFLGTGVGGPAEQR